MSKIKVKRRRSRKGCKARLPINELATDNAENILSNEDLTNEELSLVKKEDNGKRLIFNTSKKKKGSFLTIMERQTPIENMFDELIEKANQNGLTKHKTFFNLQERYIEKDGKSTRLKKLPEIMFRLHKKNSLVISEEELEVFETLPRNRQEEIAFILHIIENRTHTMFFFKSTIRL